MRSCANVRLSIAETRPKPLHQLAEAIRLFTAIGTPVKPSGEFGPVEVQTDGCVSWKQGRLSPGSVARSIKKITPELLTITEPEVSFRKRGPTAVGEGVLPDDLGRLDRRVRNGAADRTDGDHRHSDGSGGSDEQLRNVASHDRLPSMNSIATGYGRHVLKDVMGITKSAVSVAFPRVRCREQFQLLPTRSRPHMARSCRLRRCDITADIEGRTDMSRAWRTAEWDPFRTSALGREDNHKMK
jgi:hypothetical protein